MSFRISVHKSFRHDYLIPLERYKFKNLLQQEAHKALIMKGVKWWADYVRGVMVDRQSDNSYSCPICPKPN